MSLLKDRIKQARKHAGLTQRELAEVVGVSQPVISQLEKGDNLQSVHLLKIAVACSVNAAWLADGVGEMASNKLEEPVSRYGVNESTPRSTIDLVEGMLSTKAGRALSPEVRNLLISAVQDAPEEPVPRSNVLTGDFTRRPPAGDEIRIAHYDVQGAMGGGKVVHDYPEMFRDVTVSQAHLKELGVTYSDPRHLKLITGVGQSMAPTIQDRDPLIVDASIREFVGDGIYAFAWQGHFYIKTLQMLNADTFRMLSSNPAYPPQEIPVNETYIQAKVLLVWNAVRL